MNFALMNFRLLEILGISVISKVNLVFLEKFQPLGPIAICQMLITKDSQQFFSNDRWLPNALVPIFVKRLGDFTSFLLGNGLDLMATVWLLPRNSLANWEVAHLLLTVRFCTQKTWELEFYSF